MYEISIYYALRVGFIYIEWSKKEIASQAPNLAAKSFSYLFGANRLFEQKFLSQIIRMLRRYTPIIDFCDINTAVQFSPQAIQ